MPENDAMRQGDRVGVSAALSLQIALGGLIAFCLLYLLFDFFIPDALPWLGAMIRDFAEQIAAYNLFAHLMKWIDGYGW